MIVALFDASSRAGGAFAGQFNEPLDAARRLLSISRPISPSARDSTFVTDDSQPQDQLQPHLPRAADTEQRPVVYQSQELLQGRREAWIEHDGEMYRLRLTAQGKLYLTK